MDNIKVFYRYEINVSNVSLYTEDSNQLFASRAQHRLLLKSWNPLCMFLFYMRWSVILHLTVAGRKVQNH